MTFLFWLIAVVLVAIFYVPVYLPFFLSFAIKSPEWREIKWSLRIATVVSLLLAATPPPGLRHDFGDDVAGNIAGARHNFPISFAWIWGRGLLCTTAIVTFGFVLRFFRRCFNPKL
jgi:hypothetical protein